MRLAFAAAAPLVYLLLPPLHSSSAPPPLQSLFPAGAQQGTTVTVTAGGKQEPWPVEAWVSGEGVKATAAEEAGKLEIAVDPDAAPGIRWLRLYNGEGASPPRPFFVGTVPEVEEVEPNDQPSAPQQLEGPTQVVNGVLQRGGDVDLFARSLQAGQTLVAEVTADRDLGSPVDCVLQVLSSDGIVLAQNDDHRGLDPRLVFTAPAEGTYLVRVFGFPATPNSSIALSGGETMIYRLLLTTEAFVDFTRPMALAADGVTRLERAGWNLANDQQSVEVTANGSAGEEVFLAHEGIANPLRLPVVEGATITESEGNSFEKPQAITIPVSITGRIDHDGDRDAYEVEATQGQSLQVRIDSRVLGFPLDPVLEIFDGEGKSLTRVDDTGGNRDAELTFAAPADGRFRIVVSDLYGYGGERHAYRLSVAETEADFGLTVAESSWVLPRGTPLSIPVAIERRGGMNDPVELEAVGLPEGVTATIEVPADEEAEGEEKEAQKDEPAKSLHVVLTLGEETTEIPSTAFRIVGTAAGRTRTATAPTPLADSRLNDLWLTVVPPEENEEEETEDEDAG